MIITSTFGIKKEPFNSQTPTLLPSQQKIFDIIKSHASYGGFSLIIGEPGVGKTVIKNTVEQLAESKEVVCASISRTMHTYGNILTQIADTLGIDDHRFSKLEKAILEAAYVCQKQRKTLYTIVDEAHLLDMDVMRKLRLLFDKFPKNHNLIFIAQSELMYRLTLRANTDIKSRITYSVALKKLTDEDLLAFVKQELESVGLGLQIYTESAINSVIRYAEGNLRACKNLVRGSLVNACRESKKQVSINHVNEVLMQPHWRSHDDIIKNPVAE